MEQFYLSQSVPWLVGLSLTLSLRGDCGVGGGWSPACLQMRVLVWFSVLGWLAGTGSPFVEAVSRMKAGQEAIGVAQSGGDPIPLFMRAILPLHGNETLPGAVDYMNLGVALLRGGGDLAARQAFVPTTPKSELSGSRPGR